MSEPDRSCVTYGDAAVPKRVVEADSTAATALCAAEDGRRHTVQTGLVGDVVRGDQLLVHAGTAIALQGRP
jgi:hydrogenase maturation factor